MREWETRGSLKVTCGPVGTEMGCKGHPKTLAGLEEKVHLRQKEWVPSLA